MFMIIRFQSHSQSHYGLQASLKQTVPDAAPNMHCRSCQQLLFQEITQLEVSDEVDSKINASIEQNQFYKVITCMMSRSH